MKKFLALFLALAIMLSCCACTGKDPADTSADTQATEPSTTEALTITECETAQEFADNMTVGWNLGCSLSVYSEKSLAGWGVMAYFLTPDKLYSRSEVYSFDPETLTAEVSWELGKDGGVMQVYEGALMDCIGIELWNFALGEADILKYSVDELKYVTAEGEVVITEGLGEMETDMGGGTGGGTVADLEEPAVADILEIHAKVRYIAEAAGESTPETIAAAETRWGNPVTTAQMIEKVRDKGFNMIRVQVSWVNHMDDEGNIDPLWLERVAEVVDYCMDAGVYCLLNTTGAGWLTAERDTFEEQSSIYANLWKQISERFADYGELLLFESCNEVLTAAEQWWNPPVEAYAVMNDLYQIFVDTVRAGGGYNETRNLVLNPYAATYDYGMNQYFELPTDTVENHLIAQVHCYDPNNFCFNETNLGSTNFVDEWGTDAEKIKMDEIMKNIKARFIDELGIPVIIGEFGTVSRVSEEERAEYISYYARTADKYGIKLVIFDDGGDFTVFDRTTLIWPYVKIIDALFEKYDPEQDVTLQETTPEETTEATTEATQGGEQPAGVTDGWMVMAYFTTPSAQYSRSDTFTFDPETMKAEIVWKPGKDNGVLQAGANDKIDVFGIEIWNWDMGAQDKLKYRVEELVYVNSSGEVVVSEAAGEYTTDMSGGTGGGHVANVNEPAIADITEIRATVVFVEKTSG